ncbi:hypothetical protein NT01EI_0646 [Edwardsiella ictaluri 93-146]|uniref:Uncharacterized protein n=1 Tax=Edwardsiella ictaluri (strain 93-146) TaxID=634503 RepID=C5B795_EDWI9|nr:hypothetical protein NT01EI_0646 [Edwardsiella ictaluri 93-146]
MQKQIRRHADILIMQAPLSPTLATLSVAYRPIAGYTWLV